MPKAEPTAEQSIRESLSLSDSGLVHQRLWERTSRLKGAETFEAFAQTVDKMHAKGELEFKNDRWFLKKKK